MHFSPKRHNCYSIFIVSSKWVVKKTNLALLVAGKQSGHQCCFLSPGLSAEGVTKFFNWNKGQVLHRSSVGQQLTRLTNVVAAVAVDLGVFVYSSRVKADPVLGSWVSAPVLAPQNLEKGLRNGGMYGKKLDCYLI